jgi:hypothetical protein
MFGNTADQELMNWIFCRMKLERNRSFNIPSTARIIWAQGKLENAKK